MIMYNEKGQYMNKPVIGKKVWVITNAFEADRRIWTNSEGDNARYNIGNCFDTRESCEFALYDVIKTLTRIPNKE